LRRTASAVGCSPQRHCFDSIVAMSLRIPCLSPLIPPVTTKHPGIPVADADVPIEHLEKNPLAGKEAWAEA